MPKIKTHSGAKKRFSVTKNGKFKRGHVGKRHLLNGHGKTTKLKRHLRKEGFADSTNVAQLKRRCRTSKLENNIFHIGGKHNGKS